MLEILPNRNDEIRKILSHKNHEILRYLLIVDEREGGLVQNPHFQKVLNLFLNEDSDDASMIVNIRAMKATKQFFKEKRDAMYFSKGGEQEVQRIRLKIKAHNTINKADEANSSGDFERFKAILAHPQLYDMLLAAECKPLLVLAIKGDVWFLRFVLEALSKERDDLHDILAQQDYKMLKFLLVKDKERGGFLYQD